MKRYLRPTIYKLKITTWQDGFTLVEMLVAMALLATLALISWRGLDAIGNARVVNQDYQNQVLAFNAGLSQWTTDLNSIIQTPFVNALEFDGKLLRLTRLENNQKENMKVLVVAWSKANLDGKNYWIRWQSKAVSSQGELKDQYKLAKIWSDSVSSENIQDATPVVEIESWSLMYFRGNSWSNALSSADQEDSESDLLESINLPDAIRLQLQLSPQQSLSGNITKDWIKPIAGGTRQ
jgi:general secretion pathway protein J